MEQAKGNLTSQINRDKRPGDKKPVYTVRFTRPGTDQEYTATLFLGRGRDGKRYFSGPISRVPTNGDFGAQMDALLEPQDAQEPVEGQVSEFRMFLRDNEFKNDAPKKEGAGERPTLWGRAQLAADEPEIVLSVWERESRYTINPHISKYLTGETSYPLEKKVEAVAAEKSKKAKSADRDR